MNKGFLKYKNSSIHFTRFGIGQRLLIALHGFADEASMFSVLESSLGEMYVVYCLDLPFHGQTEWAEKSFNHKDLNAVVAIILEKEKKTRFELMGFSMGGRLVQKMLFDCISKVDKVYLIAPDGLNTKWMFSVNLIPNFGKVALEKIIRQPERLNRLIKQLYHWKLINRFAYNFVSYHTHTQKRRDRVFGIWYALGNFKIQPRSVKRILKEHATPVELYFGRRDEVIPLSTAKLLSNEMPNVNVHILDEGHLLINQKLNKLLKQQLTSHKG